LQIYGDSAYGLTQFLLSPYESNDISPQQQAFNLEMSRVRVSVERAFAHIVQLFPFVDFHKSLQVLKQPVGKYYAIAALLTNAHTCLYGSEAAQYFHCEPPMLKEY
ncbi:hypothetical protein BOTBODRAFT_82476, partial [Botryobasidium botryosum FD-172 SS1]